jgi:ATP adenylyltransferase
MGRHILIYLTELNVPFAYFHHKIQSNPSPASLHQAYKDLYSQCHLAVQKCIKAHPEGMKLHDTTDGSSAFSYNLGMTTTSMVLCPRRKEGEMLHKEDGSEVGFIAFNGTLLAGTLMVKVETEWQYLRAKKGVLDPVLDTIGISRESLEGGSYDSGTKI